MKHFFLIITALLTFSFCGEKPTNIEVDSVSLSITTDINLTEGESITLSAKIEPKEATNQNISWKSSNSSVVSVSEGILTALENGEAEISATSDNGKTASVKVFVSALTPPIIEVSSVSLSITTDINLIEGESITLSAKIEPKEATNQNISWKSSNPSVVSVSEGILTALEDGEAEISITSDNGKTASIKVFVSALTPPISIALNKSVLLLNNGETETLIVNISPPETIIENLIWDSSDKLVATVDNDGKVSAIREGTTTISVITHDGNNKDECIVTVRNTVERNALMAFYEASNGNSWDNNTNWGSDKPLNEWYGIKTNEYGNTIEIDLAGNKLTGIITEEIKNLSKLKSLSLSYNKLKDAIPSEIGELFYLENLEISKNQLSGNIPSEIGNLSNLKRLELNGNKLGGNLIGEIGNLGKLEYLDLSFNNISEDIPTSIGNLINLKHLFLYNNSLSGRIPKEIGNLVLLEELYLSENKLSGEIPAEIGSLINLKFLHLDYNFLTGSIPKEIGLLEKLLFLFLNNNNLSGEIPQEVINHPNYGSIDWMIEAQNKGYGFTNP